MVRYYGEITVKYIVENVPPFFVENWMLLVAIPVAAYAYYRHLIFKYEWWPYFVLFAILIHAAGRENILTVVFATMAAVALAMIYRTMGLLSKILCQLESINSKITS